MNKYVKFPLVLGTVALLSGALLATTYQLTKEKIEQGVIDRQTNAINDLFDDIDSKKVLEIPSEFASRGITSIVEVKSNSKVYKCFTINYKDSADGDSIAVIIALTSDAKVHGVKFVTVDSYISNYYNNEKYLASVVANSNFDAVGGATFSANDLNEALKIAKDCLGGKVSVDPIEELFGAKITKKEVAIPSGADQSIKKIYAVVSGNQNYYVFDTEFNDTIHKDKLKVLFALNEDGSLFKISVTLGDGYAKLYDGKTDLDIIGDATYTGQDIANQYDSVKACLEEVK